MTTDYPHLFEPLQVGPVRLPNRIVFAAHLTNQARNGLPSAGHAAYYAARAAGGTGLIITEEHSVHPWDRPYEKLIQGYDPAGIEANRRLTESVHAHGTRVFAQLNHNGPQSSGRYSRRPLWGPSAIPDPHFREVPVAIGASELAELVAGYVQTARNCVEAGYDGVELQASQSSILRAFLSKATNRRVDEWGGSTANRARLLLEVAAAVRAEIGATVALGVRLCGQESVRNGTELDEAVEVAGLLENSGTIDYLNTAIGVATETLYLIPASMRMPRDYAMFIPRAFKAAVSLPVIGVGRFTDPARAEQALADGHCDLVGVVRGQIADPDFAMKARTGRSAAIRACLSCNQECAARVGLNRWLGCVENPLAGRESVPLGAPTARSRRVLVAGGGPAGLSAAAAAARAGHAVTLFESAAELGGQLALAGRVPSRAELLRLVTNLQHEASRAGADIRLGQRLEPSAVYELAPDVVIVATGALPSRPVWASIHGAAVPRIVDVTEVLAGTATPAGSVIVIDELGFHQASSVAELLADRGCCVELATPSMVVAQDLGLTLDLEQWTRRAAVLGISARTDVSVRAARTRADGRIELDLHHHPSGDVVHRVVDWVVCALQQTAADQLWRELRAAYRGTDGPALYRIGDCLAPRRAHAAVLEGHRVAAGL